MKKRTLKSIKAGEKFQVDGSNRVHVAKTAAMLCGRGYVRVETTLVVSETGSAVSIDDCVNIHGSNPVAVFS